VRDPVFPLSLLATRKVTVNLYEMDRESAGYCVLARSRLSFETKVVEKEVLVEASV
jgi:hypothetical protein